MNQSGQKNISNESCMPQVLSGIIYIILNLNLDNSINIVHRLLKFSMVILDVMMEGTVSQIF